MPILDPGYGKTKFDIHENIFADVYYSHWDKRQGYTFIVIADEREQIKVRHLLYSYRHAPNLKLSNYGDINQAPSYHINERNGTFECKISFAEHNTETAIEFRLLISDPQVQKIGDKYLAYQSILHMNYDYVKALMSQCYIYNAPIETSRGQFTSSSDVTRFRENDLIQWCEESGITLINYAKFPNMLSIPIDFSRCCFYHYQEDGQSSQFLSHILFGSKDIAMLYKLGD